jgi:two-component system response regulator FixJ
MAPEPVIYIVDDDDAVRDSLSVLLGATGLRVRTFASAQGLLDDLPQAGSGCVITDVHMPGMGGLELLERLRARKVALPVIVISGRGGPRLAAEAAAAGAAAVIEKPFAPDALIAAIRAALA